MFDIAFIQHQARFGVCGMRGLERDVDILRSDGSSPRLTAQAVGPVVMVDWLVHHVPRVHSDPVMLHDGGDVVRHYLSGVCARHIGLKPIGQGVPPDQAMTAEEQAVASGPGNDGVARDRSRRRPAWDVDGWQT